MTNSLLPIHWQNIYAIDNVGMTPDHAAIVRESLQRVEASAEGQQLFRDLRAAGGTLPIPIRMADPQHRLISGDNAQRALFYVEGEPTVYINPRFATLLQHYSSVATELAGLLIHEGDHGVRDGDIQRCHATRSWGKRLACDDDIETSAQNRMNRFYAEIEHPPRPYFRPTEATWHNLRSNPPPPTGYTVQQTALTVMGTGQLARFQNEPDNSNLARFIAGIAQNGVSAGEIEAYLNSNPPVPVAVAAPLVGLAAGMADRKR